MEQFTSLNIVQLVEEMESSLKYEKIKSLMLFLLCNIFFNTKLDILLNVEAVEVEC